MGTASGTAAVPPLSNFDAPGHGRHTPVMAPTPATSFTVLGRRRDSDEARERRRFSRKARTTPPVRAEQAETLVRARMRAVVFRMLRRFVPAELRDDPILNRYDYWSLRRFGYNAFSDEMRWTGERDANGDKVLHDTDASPVWLWWTSTLHWRQRLSMSGGSHYILKGLCPKQEETAYSRAIHNPLFEVVSQPVTRESMISLLNIS